MTASALVPARPAGLDPTAPWLDRALYPYAARAFHSGDGTLRYADAGAGRPVFMVHGTPSWSFEWRHVMSALGRTRRVIAADHLGFGLSDKPAGAPYRVSDHAARLLALFDSLDLHDVTLVVHDFGGPIGLPIALARPSRIAKVVIVNSWMWPLDDDPRIVKMSRFVRSGLGRFLYTWLNLSPRVLLPASFADRSKLTRAVHRHYVAPFATRAQRVAPWMLGTELSGASDHYRRLWEGRSVLAGRPLALVWGAKDPAFDLEYLRKFQREFPHARTLVAENAGHFPQEEEPDVIVQAIAD